jgi:hypothetical protein
MKSSQPAQVYQELRIRISELHYDAIKVLAREEETTVNYIINQILTDFFDRVELFDGEA